MDYHLIEDGFFARTVQIDPLHALPGRGTTVAPPALEGGQVARWAGGTWEVLPERPVVVPPTLAVPSAVTMRQARLALLGAGLLDDVDAAINSLPSPQKEAARIEWEYSQEVQRHNGFVSVLAPMLGLTEAQTDALFVAAKGL